MRRATVLVAGALLAGCGGGEDGTPPASSTAPPGTGTPTKLAGGAQAQVLAHAGCLACHRVGADGNDAPGSDLTHIGSQLSPGEIRAVIVEGATGMPSFAGLPADDLEAIVDYLSGRR